MKFIIPAAILVFIGLVAAALVTPNYMDWSKHKSYLENKVAGIAGMPGAKISGPIVIKTLPAPKVSFGKVELLPFQGDDNVAVIEDLRTEFSWKTLFSLSLKPKYIRAESVAINLVKIDEGSANYLPKRHSRRISSNAPRSLYPLGGFGDVDIKNLTLTLTDKALETSRTLTTERLALESPSLAKTQINTTGSLDDVPFSLSGEVDLSSLRQVPVDLSMSLSKSRLQLTGTAYDPFYQPMYTGAVKARVSKLGEPFAALGLDVPKTIEQSKELSNITFQSNVMVNGSEVALNEIVAGLNVPAEGDNLENTRREQFEGNILYKYRTSNTPADLGVTLTGQNINMSQFFSAASGDKSKADKQWSDAPFDLTLMAAQTFNLRFDGQNIAFSGNSYDTVKLRVMNSESTLTVEELTADANGGTMKLSGVYGHARTDPALEARIRIRNMPLQSITQGSISKTITGSLTGSIDLKSKGISEKELISNLNGKGEFHITDGALLGMKLKDTITAVKKLFKRNESDERTDFSNMSLTFDIKDGTLSNDDFYLHSEKAALKADGKIDFVNWTINFKVKPQLETGLVDLLVPVSISGDLGSPQIAPIVTSSTGRGAAIGAILGGPIGAGIGALIGSKTSGSNKKPEQTDPLSKKEIHKLEEQIEDELDQPLPFELEDATPEDVRNFLDAEQE